MTNYPSKDTFRYCVSIKCRKLPAKMTTPKRRSQKKFEVCFNLPIHFYHSKNPVNRFKDILTMNLDFRSLGGIKQCLTYKMINYGEYKANWLGNSLVLCRFPSAFTGYAVEVGFFVFVFVFTLHLFPFLFLY